MGGMEAYDACKQWRENKLAETSLPGAGKHVSTPWWYLPLTHIAFGIARSQAFIPAAMMGSG
jgi:hypothetical protein